MAAAKNKLVKAEVETISGTNISVFFRSNHNLYTGAVATTTGITIPTDEADLAQPAMPIPALIKAGYIFKVNVLLAGVGTKPPQVRELLCSNLKFNDFRKWANKGTNALPSGEIVIRGGLRMNRLVLR